MTQLDIEDTAGLPARAKPDLGADLRGRLPELRMLPGFPLATDDAIIRMSQAPGHTACPNPYATRLAVPRGDPTRRNPGPFASDLSTGKGHLIYKAHSYPTKVPHAAIMRFLLHYTEPGDLVLDGFAGSGMAGVAAQACGAPDDETKAEIDAELGAPHWGARRAVLQDLGPGATFLAAGLNLPVDADAFEQRSNEMLESFQRDWGWMYETTAPNGKAAVIDYTVWSEVFTCPHCGGEIVFYDAAFDEATKGVRERFTCPQARCGAEVTKDDLVRRFVRVRTLAGDVIERIELRPVRIFYRVGKLRGSKKPDDRDVAVLRRIAGVRLSGFPTDELPLADMTHGSRLGPKGFKRLHHLWSDRALVTLTVLWQMAESEADPRLRMALLFWVEQGLWGFSWMNRFVPGHYSHVNQFLNGVYYVSSLHAEPSPEYNLVGTSPGRGKRALLTKMWRTSPAREGQVAISTGSSEHVPLPDACVDYVFVDPPFGSNIPYADLALLVEQWHGVRTNASREAIVDAARHKGLPEYTSLMEACFREFYRVLVPGRWMTVEFSNSSNSVWLGIQQALASAGFVVADTRIFDKEQLSFRQITARNAVRRDLVISCYKPTEALDERVRLAAGSEEGVWAFVRQHLAHLTVTAAEAGRAQVIRERQADRLFDRMVAYHVARGLSFPMGAAEFAAGLDRRFVRRDGMYFLPDQALEYERFRLDVHDMAQQTMFITNESSAVEWLRDRLSARRLTYGEIQPQFFAEAQAGQSEWEDIPDLRQLLEDHFVQDTDGRWEVPDPKKAEHLEQLRQRRDLREFGEYTSSKGKITRFRSEVIRAGFRDAWARRDFASIVNVGRRLPEDVFTEDPQLHQYFRNAERRTG